MHSRRASAFVIGAWLAGTLLMALVTSQSLTNVERLLGDPPRVIRETTQALGQEAVRAALRQAAIHSNWHLTETWNAVQICLGAALLVTALLTPRRSRVVAAAALLMLGIVIFLQFYLLPLTKKLALIALAGGNLQQDSYLQCLVWKRVLEVLKLLAGLTIAARLLFDRQEWMRYLARAGAESRTREPTSERLEQI